MRNRGKFITFEGPEGCGKSTHAQALADRLRRAGAPVLLAREPGGTRAGEAIRRMLQRGFGREPMCSETEMFLFMASRAQLVRRVILPALASGTHVICDRFADSTTVYQGYGRGVSLARILAINNFAVRGLAPDVTILLDLDVRAGFARLRRRNRRTRAGKDRIEREALEFHERVRAGYLELARRRPARFKIVDAARPFSAVRAEIWEVVRHVLAG